MLADTLPFRLSFWLQRPARLDAIPAWRAPETPEPMPAGIETPLRPAVDLETRLMLRDRGWRP